MLVGVITTCGFAAVYISRKAEISGASLSYALFFFGLYLIAHVVARLTVPYADPYLLPIAGVLTAIGLTEIYRLGPANAFKQGVWIVIGVAVFALALLAFRRDYRLLENYKYLFGLSAIGLLFMPLLPGIGQTVNGARLWIHVGGLQFQPGELGKVALVVFLAAYLREKREVLAQGRLKDWGPLLVIWGGAMLVLLVTYDLGSALLYYGIFLALLYAATARVSFVVVALGLFLAGSAAVYQGTPRKPALRQDCGSYQEVQSLYSIAHGHFAGTGLGVGTFASTNGHPLIPDLSTDFIYSALAQELGLVGVSALLLVYMVFVMRGFRVSIFAGDGFSKLLAAGLTFGFALQAFVIVGGILRVIPLTGITLPFVSYGGSSVVSNFLVVAGLMLVSNRANREAERE